MKTLLKLTLAVLAAVLLAQNVHVGTDPALLFDWLLISSFNGVLWACCVIDAASIVVNCLTGDWDINTGHYDVPDYLLGFLYAALTQSWAGVFAALAGFFAAFFYRWGRHLIALESSR